MPTAPSAIHQHAHRRAAAWLGAVLLVTLAAYARACGGSFQFDDHSVLIAREEGHLSTIGGFVSFARGRLLPFVSLALNYWAGGENPFWYHAVNVAVHLLATGLVFGLALAVCRTPRVSRTPLAAAALPCAVAAAAIFACHPIQVQAVTYVVQRAASMAALFYVGAVLFYVRGRNAQVGAGPGRPAPAFVASAACAVAAFLSKENTASLPAAILLAEWAFYGGAGMARRALRLLPYLLLALIIPLWWRLWASAPERPQLGDSLVEQAAAVVRLMVFRANPRGDIAPLDYLLTQCVVIPRYLGLVVLPWGFNVDHDVAVQRGVSAPVAGGLALLAALAVFGVLAVRRWPVTGFGILWCFVTLSVESSLLPLSDVMMEHRMYLAMPGVALVVGSGFAWAFRRQRLAAVVGGSLAAVALASLTAVRNEVWRTPVSLWSDAVAKSPDKARPHVNLGLALLSDGRRDEAIRHYCRALALDPLNQQAHTNLAVAVEEHAGNQLDAGEDIELEAVTLEPDGTIALEPPDPCANQ